MARGILVPQPRMEPEPPALEVQSLNHWTTGEVPSFFLSALDNFFKYIQLCSRGIRI